MTADPAQHTADLIRELLGDGSGFFTMTVTRAAGGFWNISMIGAEDTDGLLCVGGGWSIEDAVSDLSDARFRRTMTGEEKGVLVQAAKPVQQSGRPILRVVSQSTENKSHG